MYAFLGRLGVPGGGLVRLRFGFGLSLLVSCVFSSTFFLSSSSSWSTVEVSISFSLAELELTDESSNSDTSEEFSFFAFMFRR